MNQLTQGDYRSWMLRLRRASAHDRWHFSLQCTSTGEVLHFAGLPALLDYLGAFAIDQEHDSPAPP